MLKFQNNQKGKLFTWAFLGAITLVLLMIVVLFGVVFINQNGYFEVEDLEYGSSIDTNMMNKAIPISE